MNFWLGKWGIIRNEKGGRKRTWKPESKAAAPGPGTLRPRYPWPATSRGDPRRPHQYLIGPSLAGCRHSPAGLARHHPRCAEAGAQARRGLWKDPLFARPLAREALLGGRGAAPTMRGCPRLALLCALLPWLLRAAAPRRPAQPLPLRDPRDPARGADFDRVYSGVVSLSTENIYSFNYTSQPGQVRHSLSSFDSQELARSQSPVAALGPLGIDLGSPQRPEDPRSLSPSPSLPCPGPRTLPQPASGTTPVPLAPSLAWSPGISGLCRFSAPSVAPGPLLCLSLGNSRFLGLRRERTAPLFLIPCGEGTSFHLDDSARPFYSIAHGEGELLRI